MEARTIRAHVFIQGRVQGINYRWWTSRTARGLQLTGWARNLDDGRVEAIFEGPKKKVEAMINKCKRGPMLSRVDHIDVIWEKATRAVAKAMAGRLESFRDLKFYLILKLEEQAKKVHDGW